MRSIEPTDGIRPVPQLDRILRSRLTSLQDEGHEIWSRFDVDVRRHDWHPFVPADYERVLTTLVDLREPGLRFLEWGSATGVIAIMADLIGYDACGIEIDGRLVTIARQLALQFHSAARFVEGSFLPAGYEFRTHDGDTRLGTIAHGPSGYLELGRALEDFDLIFGYPWGGEEVVMHDVMRKYGSKQARFLLNVTGGIEIYSQGKRVG